MNNKRLLEALASVNWTQNPRNRETARILARLTAVSPQFRNLIGSPISFQRGKRIQSILRRRRYLMNKMRQGSPLNREEREFLEFFDIGRFRGNAYMRGLAPRLHRTNFTYTPNVLRYYNAPMRLVIGGPGMYATRQMFVEPYNRYRKTGKRTGTLSSREPNMYASRGKQLWSSTIKKSLLQKRRRG